MCEWLVLDSTGGESRTHDLLITNLVHFLLLHACGTVCHFTSGTFSTDFQEETEAVFVLPSSFLFPSAATLFLAKQTLGLTPYSLNNQLTTPRNNQATHYNS